MIVPSESREAWLASHGRQARHWLDRLPGLASALMNQWSCVAAGPVRAGFGGVVQPVRRADGTRAVLKMSVPHDAADVESTILETWAGRGAVLLLERDDANRALLLEELEDASLGGVA